MRSERVLLVLCLVLISQNVRAGNYLVRWPPALLLENSNTRINELIVTLKCGDFRAVHNLPEDWNLEIVRPISGISELRAEAGHGFSSISSMVDFNDVIKIGYLPENVNCFELSATVTRFDQDIAVEVKHGDFTFIPVP